MGRAALQEDGHTPTADRTPGAGRSAPPGPPGTTSLPARGWSARCRPALG